MKQKEIEKPLFVFFFEKIFLSCFHFEKENTQGRKSEEMIGSLGNMFRRAEGKKGRKNMRKEEEN